MAASSVKLAYQSQIEKGAKKCFIYSKIDLE